MMKKLLIIAAFCFTIGNAVFAAAPENPIIRGNSRLTLISPTLLRLEYAQEGKFIDKQTMFAWDRENLLEDFTITELPDGRLEINTSALRIEWQVNGFPFGLQNFEVFYTLGGKEKKFNVRNRKGGNLGGAVSTLDMVRGPVPLDDGLLSRNGWYIITDTGKDIIKDDWLALRDASHVQDMYCFVYGDDYRSALRDLGLISGRVPMTRRHVHGIWYCRWWDYTADEYRDIVGDYRKNGFPLDNIVFDMGWHTQDAKVGAGHASRMWWTGYTWDRNLIPDPKEIIEEFARDNIRVSLNDHPHDGIRPHEEMYGDFMRAMGHKADAPSLLFDAGNRKYMENFFKYAHGPSWDAGIDFWWLDWQQDYIYPLVRGTSTSHLSWLNHLYFNESKHDGLRGANYSRWAGWGDQRHPIQFSGDAFANWEMLSFEVELTATSGNAGCYYWAHDIGGFYGGRDPEMYARWTQFGAVSAAMRTHSQLAADLDRRPWLWGEQATESMRRSYHLRAEMMPYIYSSVWQTHSTMVPLNRAMYIDYKEDERAYNSPQQFMFGDLLLAAPITSPGEGASKMASQKVFFPKIEGKWYDMFDHTGHDGGVEKSVTKDLNEFPIFVKGGWVLPLQPYNERPASAPLDTLILRAYPGVDGADNLYTLYEDDGVTSQYESGRFSTTALRYARTGNKVTITATNDGVGYDGKVAKRIYRIELPAVEGVSDVRINGKRASAKFDQARGVYVVQTTLMPTEKAMVFSAVVR